MGILFGKSKKKEPDKKKVENKITEKDKAILELKRQRDRLQKQKIQMQSVIDRETEAARTLLKKGLKQRAVLALKKKKFQQSLYTKADAQLFNIEEMVNSIEFAEVEQKVFAALSKGNQTLQEINSQMKIEDVEKLMDDSAEAIAYQNEISEMLSGALSNEDEQQIEEEFEQLQNTQQQDQQQQEQKLASDVSALPSPAPKRVVDQANTKEEVAERKTPAKKTQPKAVVLAA